MHIQSSTQIWLSTGMHGDKIDAERFEVIVKLTTIRRRLQTGETPISIEEQEVRRFLTFWKYYFIILSKTKFK